MELAACGDIKVHPLELVNVGDAEQGVAGGQAVIEEREGAVAVYRDEPQGQLRHLDGHGVDVDAIEAVLDDLAAGP